MIAEFMTAFATLNQSVQTLILAFAAILTVYLIKLGVIDLLLKKFLGKKSPKKPEVKPGVQAHEDCPHFPSLVLMMREAMYKNIKMYSIKIEQTIYDQLNLFEDLFDDLFKIYKSDYLTLYKTKKKIKADGILNHIQVKFYLSLLRESKTDMKKLTIKFMKENHFLEKTEVEFLTYKVERAEDYIQALSEHFDDVYNSDDFDVSREALYKSNMLCVDKVNAKIFSFFDKVRIVSKNNQKKIKKLESEIKEFL